jgi:acyl-coenzyme A synthetase/AMP-(fatty) acid ligase
MTLFQADAIAAGFLTLGLEPGNRLGIWSQNSSEAYITYLAAVRAGLIAVSPHARPEGERGSLGHLLRMRQIIAGKSTRATTRQPRAPAAHSLTILSSGH